MAASAAEVSTTHAAPSSRREPPEDWSQHMKGHTNGIQDLMCCILVPSDINCAGVIGDDLGSDGLVEVQAAKVRELPNRAESVE